MANPHLTYFQENFDLAFSCKLNWKEINIGFEDFCAIQLTKTEFKNPHKNVGSIVWKNWKGAKIPFIFNTSYKEEIITHIGGNKVIINFDILSSAWYLMSGKQELENQNRDNYGRFPYQESIQHKLKITGIPLVNYYFDILKEAIEISTGSKLKISRKFTATITHDIDEVTSGWKHRIRTELNDKRYVKAFLHGLSQPFKPFFPWKNLEELEEFNRRNGVFSTFFILPRNNKVEEIKNAA